MMIQFILLVIFLSLIARCIYLESLLKAKKGEANFYKQSYQIYKKLYFNKKD